MAQEITPSRQNPPAELTRSQRQQLDLLAFEITNLNPFHPPIISPEQRTVAQQSMVSAERLTQAGTTHERLEILVRLRSSCPLQNMEGAMSEAFLEDALDDLQGVSLAHLKLAAKRWRNSPNPDCKWFPRRAADLKQLVETEMKAHRQHLEGLRRIINYERPEPLERMTEERMAEIRREESKRGQSAP